MELAEIITVSPDGVDVDLAGGRTIRYDSPKTVKVTVLYEVLELYSGDDMLPPSRKDMGHAVKAVIETSGGIETVHKVFAMDLTVYDVDDIKYPLSINTETTGSPIKFHPEFRGCDSLDVHTLQDVGKDKGEALDGAERKIERVRKAIKNPGNRPDYHAEQMFRLMNEWPTLFYAVMELIDDAD